MKTFFKNKLFSAKASVTIMAFIAIMSILGATGCGRVETGRERIRVAAGIVPLAEFCRNVGGDLVEVETMVPPGSNPHTYELTTGQMRFLAEADVLVINGLGLTPWTETILKGADNPDIITVVAGETVPQGELIPVVGIRGGVDSENDSHEPGIYDPHVWLDPELAIYIVDSIRDGFIEADPVHESIYRENSDHFIKELQNLDEQIRDEVDTFTSNEFVSFHSSWTYFARRYDLEQVAVIEELPGKEPTAGRIAALINEIRDLDVRVVFAEPQFNPQVAEAIIEEAGEMVELKILDPLGDPENPRTDTYLKTVRYDVAVMGEILR